MTHKYKDALVSMVWQFAYHGVKNGKPMLWTGGSSVLGEAFFVLRWADPHFIPEQGNTCEVVGCMEQPTAQTHWDGMYVCICSKHYRNSYSGKSRPAIKQWALDREATRDKDGRLP